MIHQLFLFASNLCGSCGDFSSHYSIRLEEETKKTPYLLSCYLRKAWFLLHLYILNHCWCYLETFSNYEDRHLLVMFLNDKFLYFFFALVKNWSLTSVDLGATSSRCKDQGVNAQMKNKLLARSLSWLK